jgi:phage terminase Nu1 subunit (DNA packaging protein)
MIKRIKPEEFISQREFALLRGVSPKSVSVWKKKGLLVVTADGLIDVEASNTILDARPAQYRGGTASAPSGQADKAPAPAADDLAIWTLVEAVRQKENALARLRQVQLRKADGKTIEAEDIEPAWARMMIAIRTALIAVPEKLRLKMPTLAKSQIEIIKREIHAAMKVAARTDCDI